MLLQTHFGTKLTERNSLIIFDEVQMFPQARAAIKYLVADGRYDYIETGSLISIRENVKEYCHTVRRKKYQYVSIGFRRIRNSIRRRFAG